MWVELYLIHFTLLGHLALGQQSICQQDGAYWTWCYGGYKNKKECKEVLKKYFTNDKYSSHQCRRVTGFDDVIIHGERELKEPKE